MKKINYMMLSCLFVLLGSCTEEVQQKGEQPAPEGGSDAITRQEVTLSLKNKLVLDREKTKGETIATAEENAISALDVYVFASETENGDYSFMERFAYRNTPDAVLPAGASELQLTPTDADAKETTGLLKVKKGLFVKLYCIANNTTLVDPAHEGQPVDDAAFVPLELSTTDDNKTTVKTPGVPLETTFATWHTHLLTSTVQADTLATPLAMTGALITPLDLTDFGSAARVQAGIRLTRLVARYDIINEAGTSRFIIETVSMGNARRGSDLFPIRPYGDMPEAKPDELITTPERRFYGENANKGIQAGAFYSYPSPLKDKGFLILKGMYKINESESKEVSYRIPFTQQAADGNQTFLEIANNHRYTIAITAADKYHLDCTLYVADWTDDGSIDDFKPDQDSGEIDVTIPAEFTDDTKYDPDTRSVSMSLKPKSQFTVTTTATANLTVYKKYVGGIDAQQYDWLEISEPAVSTKAASMNYNYTFSLKENYTLGRYPRAVLRFTNTMNGSETTFFVEAVSVPQADVTPQVGDNNPNSFDAENKLVNLYRITGSNAHVRITCPDGSEVESKPDWLDVAVYKQSGAETTYSFTLNDRDVSGVTDDKGTVVFYNKKANDLKTDIVVQLLDATLKPDFTYPSLNDGKNSYEAPAGDTPGNINMQISDNNEFSIGCKSMLGIEIGLDFDGGSEWLKVKGAPVTKALNENTQLTFSLDNAKLRGAKKATVTLKNKIGGENTVFTVSPIFPVPTVTFVSGSNSPTQNTMTGTDIKLYQVKGSQVSIKANALGGTCVKNIEGDITVEAADDYAVEKTYVVTWKSGNSATFQIANKSDETKATTTYTVNAPATTIEASNLYVKAANSGNTNISVTSPEGVKATVLNWNKGDQWFDISTDQTTGSGAKNIVITQRNNINAIMKSVTIRLTNKIAGGASKDITVTPNGFVAPTLSESSKTFDNFSKSYSTTTTFTVSSPGGSNYVKMTNESVASISKSNNKYTITLKDKGSTVITIANASSTDLTSTYTLTVKASKNYNGKTAYIYGNYLIAPEDAASSIALKDVDKTICSKQTGATWRIPTSSEWRTILGTSGTNALPSSSALWQDWYNKNLFVLTLGAYASMTSYFSSDSETMRFFSGGANVATENNQNAIGHVRCITDK
ncbi:MULTISPECIES: hypothetical protein [Parabacteroides]|uniref:DUF4906 domain-containing protein n=4 Tax=Parabacteroides goldsteinii TaxID=328812 RepID=A0A6G1ZFB2_9BACT|nr:MULTISPECIES: hypothetical protein [Parabacteroides]EOS18175.1 hypothetical protein C803_01836 [Parabacteroides goldsteinii dnLKV18]KAI4362011.1 hypothetical protein C825_004088 [Parabacteroides sp. ASF519]MBF0766668.1 hypothetical protein [Parabacteroides goldsteinii]MDZ3928329.1 hypothetical protein [Parabacteroides goldsteinii]MRX92840.1 hypothetical protein [Parabacteroides goldsteinii]